MYGFVCRRAHVKKTLKVHFIFEASPISFNIDNARCLKRTISRYTCSCCLKIKIPYSCSCLTTQDTLLLGFFLLIITILSKYDSFVHVRTVL